MNSTDARPLCASTRRGGRRAAWARSGGCSRDRHATSGSGDPQPTRFVGERRAEAVFLDGPCRRTPRPVRSLSPSRLDTFRNGLSSDCPSDSSTVASSCAALSLTAFILADVSDLARGSTRAWRRLRLAVLHAAGWRCQVPVDATGRAADCGPLCGLPANTVDHIRPRALGGGNEPANLRAACARHNYGRRVPGVGGVPAEPGAGTRRQGDNRSWSW